MEAVVEPAICVVDVVAERSVVVAAPAAVVDDEAAGITTPTSPESETPTPKAETSVQDVVNGLYTAAMHRGLLL